MMRDLQQEAALWNLFTEPKFFENAARECEDTMKWFANVAASRHVTSFGRNSQIYDAFKTLSKDLRRGAEFAKYDDYELIWNCARSARGDIRGIMEQPLRSWMTETEYEEFSGVKIDRLIAYTSQITRALTNAMWGAESFFDDDPDYADRRNDDDGFPGSEIVDVYMSWIKSYNPPLNWEIVVPPPEYRVDTSVECATGEVVPLTGIWCPSIGLEGHSLTFAIKERRMQPAYRVTKSRDESRAEGALIPMTETVAFATTWHPVIASVRQPEKSDELRAKAGEPCPRAGVWQPMEPGADRRAFKAGETMTNIGTAYGITVWRWVADR